MFVESLYVRQTQLDLNNANFLSFSSEPSKDLAGRRDNFALANEMQMNAFMAFFSYSICCCRENAIL